MSELPGKSFEQHLKGAFGDAAPEHFWWQTEAPMSSERERDLAQAAFLPVGERVLDLGCAEGATLLHLGSPKGAVGIDLFEDKLAFARKRLPDCTFVKGSAYELPFEDGQFDHVLIRDVIHHIEEPERVVAEIARVLSPGGRLDVLEPCRNNPLILMHALTHKEERGELRSTMTYLTNLANTSLSVTKSQHLQAFPIHRLILHPKMGSPSRGASPFWRKLIDGLEGAAERVMPSWSWAYIHVRAEKRA